MDEPKSLANAIMQIYPDLKPNIDFVVLNENDVQTIAVWNSDKNQPTSEELDAAWNAYIANPPQKPLSDIENLQKDQADLTFQLMVKGVI